ncbi:hypothetical protein PVAP13_3KG160527 [Panicum virgatum]|uniref:Uncharacterized protein n=1 Tax=Panicum virgatum TaxID=38727 RepID=A0A8T0USA1_PANVG|nr:hypothetical protein PVAP13_3KG160527 [Panicum virgatum]
MDMNRNTIQRCPRIIANPLSRLRSALRLPHRRPPLAALPPLSTCQATHRATDVVVSAPSPFPLRPCHSRRIVPYIMRPPIRFVPPPGHRRQAPATCLSSPLHSQSRPLHFDVGSARYTAPPHRAPLPLHHRCHEVDAMSTRAAAPAMACRFAAPATVSTVCKVFDKMCMSKHRKLHNPILRE